jgi:hypothetical protein
MTDDEMQQLTNNIMEEMAAAKEQLRRRLKQLAELLSSQGIRCVAVEYSGAGDEGLVERVRCLAEPCSPEAVWDAEELTELDASLDRFNLNHQLPDDSPIRQWAHYGSLADVVGDTLCELAPANYEDGEGGEGIVVFDTQTGQATVRHGYHTLHTNYEQYDFDKDT